MSGFFLLRKTNGDCMVYTLWEWVRAVPSVDAVISRLFRCLCSCSNSVVRSCSQSSGDIIHVPLYSQICSSKVHSTKRVQLPPAQAMSEGKLEHAALVDDSKGPRHIVRRNLELTNQKAISNDITPSLGGRFSGWVGCEMKCIVKCFQRVFLGQLHLVYQSLSRGLDKAPSQATPSYAACGLS